MDDEPHAQGRGSRLLSAAILGAVIAGVAAAGVVISSLQRSPAPPATPDTAPVPVPAIGATPTPGPAAPDSVFGFSVADDVATARLVFFGGVDSYDQTWLWDGARWSHALPAASPPGRLGAAAAYDPQTAEVMLFGGRLAAGRLVDDTWGWTGTTWHRLDDGSAAPPAGEGSLMAWDDATHDMVLVTPTSQASGGETWEWAGTHWVRQPAGDVDASPIAGEMAFDPQTASLLLVSPLLPPTGVGTTTWRWTGGFWEELGSPPPTATAGLALDPVSNRLLLCSNPTSVAPSRLWAWSGATWAAVPGSEFSQQLGMEVADASRGEFLILGFADPATLLRPQPVHVWLWTGQVWRQLDI